MEILDTFGLGSKVLQAGAQPFTWVNWYSPDADGKFKLARVTKNSWKTPSPWISHTLSQAKIQDILEEYIAKHSSIKIDRGIIEERLEVRNDQEYPVELAIRRAPSIDGSLAGQESMNNSRVDDDAEILEQSRREGGVVEVVKAKYIVACDGAHSWTRRTLGIPMVGDETDMVWGVVDIVPITDFPTPRVSNLCISKGSGVQWVAREEGLIRIYCVLDSAQSDAEGKLIRSSVTLESIMKEIRRRLHPYKIDYTRCDWWAAYQVGQRVAMDNIDRSGRIFLAGDAVHTHSPQAGVGLNVSMQDAYNLMWKLNLVIKGAADPKILQTYRDERLVIGQRVVDLDRIWCASLAGREPPPTPMGTYSAEVVTTKIYSAAGPVFQNLSVLYPPGLLVSASPSVEKEAKLFLDDGVLPPGIVAGMRMPTFRVRQHCNSWIQYLHEAFTADGRFRFIVFAGDISKQPIMQRLRQTAEHIESLELMSVIDVLTVHTTEPPAVEQLNLPAICNPPNPQTGYDYGKVFYSETIVKQEGEVIASAYEKYGIDHEQGRLVLLRPDCHVAYHGPIDDFEPIRHYFDAFVIRQDA